MVLITKLTHFTCIQSVSCVWRREADDESHLGSLGPVWWGWTRQPTPHLILRWRRQCLALQALVKGQEARCSETFIALSLTVSMDKISLLSLCRCPVHVCDTLIVLRNAVSEKVRSAFLLTIELWTSQYFLSSRGVWWWWWLVLVCICLQHLVAVIRSILPSSLPALSFDGRNMILFWWGFLFRERVI